MAWAFTRISGLGVWRYLKNVDEVNCPRFLFVSNPNDYSINQINKIMKQQRLTFLLTLLMSMMGITASAHDIEAQNADGVTIYYEWINNNTELAVSFRGSDSYAYENEYSGNIVIPESVTYDGNTYSVTRIGYDAFSHCTDLTSIEIPNSVTSIGGYAFANCPALTSVVSEIQEPFEIEKGIFEYFDYDARSYYFTSATLYVPKGTKEKYLATSAWNLFGDNIVEMENPTEIKSACNEETEKMESYDLNGYRLDAPKKGLNIIRMSDGTTKKVVVK